MPRGEIDVARNLVARARKISGLAERYVHVGKIEDLTALSQLPVMTRKEFALTVQETAAAARGRPAYVFASGGTTSVPKLSYMPAGLFVDEIMSHWFPLGRGDVFLNAYNAGKLWSSHHFHNYLASAAGSRILPVGTIAEPEIDAWIEFCAIQQVTAIGATPSTLRSFFMRARDLGRLLPQVRALLWVGESWDDAITAAAADVSPQAARWGLYGSTETWVIGINSPGCDADTFHVLPYQHVQIGAVGMIDVTCLHQSGLNLLLRYQPGDACSLAGCDCGSELATIKVAGRRDDVTKFRGSLLNADDIVTEAKRWPGVNQAQVVLQRDGRNESLEIRLLADAGSGPEIPEELRKHFLATNMDIDSVFGGDPGSFRVRVVRSLIKSKRTAKTPAVIDARRNEDE